MYESAVAKEIEAKKGENTTGLSPLSREVLKAAHRNSTVSAEEQARAREKAFAELHKALDRQNPPEWEYENHGSYSTLGLKR